MNNFENLRVDTTKQNQDQSVLANCCAPDCCDTSDNKCCEENQTETCCEEAKNSVCCSDSEKSRQDCCQPKDNSSCCDDNSSEPCCDSNDSSCCDGGEKTSTKIEVGIATIDGKKVEVTSSDKNLVELAKKIGVNIPAPCYFAKSKGGCCKACVVDVDGKQSYVCGTAPQKGMKITVNRADLKELRRERILKYKAALKIGNPIACFER